jgi:flagellar biosynthetic protein FlhB
VAQRIREIGQAAGVTIYPYPTLAQDLYRQVEVGDEVPVAFYQAVAEVLAFVYRLKHRAIG